jgi:cytochrome c
VEKRVLKFLIPALVFLGTIGPAFADTPDGAALFRKACTTCHASEKNAAPRQGPNLFGVVGRKAGTAAGYSYSPGFRAGAKDITWDRDTLDRWLTDPQTMIPGAVMLYKQPDPDRRAAVIQYLTTLK